MRHMLRAVLLQPAHQTVNHCMKLFAELVNTNFLNSVTYIQLLKFFSILQCYDTMSCVYITIIIYKLT